VPIALIGKLPRGNLTRAYFSLALEVLEVLEPPHCLVCGPCIHSRHGIVRCWRALTAHSTNNGVPVLTGGQPPAPPVEVLSRLEKDTWFVLRFTRSHTFQRPFLLSITVCSSWLRAT
jgi:hypothetical protein